MKKPPTNVSASVIARLKNISDKEHLDFNFLFLRYIQERFLSRLAASNYINKFVLKRGLLLLAYNIEKARPTKDIDFLGVDVSSNQEEIKRLIKEIATADLGDVVTFLTDSIKSQSITEDAGYEGIRLKITARVGTARNTIQIDLGFGDIISPRPVHMDYPTLLDGKTFDILVYSKETIVAEKFEAIVKLGTINSRMKDFYDISFLASQFAFEATALQSAVKNTFDRRLTSLTSAKERLQAEFENEDEFQHQWATFKNRTRPASKQDFTSVFEDIQSFLLPVVNGVLEGISINQVWNGRARRWE